MTLARRCLSVVVAGALLAGCSSGASGASGSEPGSDTQATPSAPATGLPSPAAGAASTPPAAVSPVQSRLVVPPGLDEPPFDDARTVVAPEGWTVSLWARLPGARLAAWAPDGSLLVSRPRVGDVVRLAQPADGASSATPRTLVAGLRQPHGLAFAGPTLYVAQSHRVDAFAYRSGTLSGRRTVVTGLPDAKSPDLGGAYAHALKSVAVGRDGAVYVSVGSTGNITAEDRRATPQRASILRVPPGGGDPQVFARGVRNGTGLAIDPAGAVWTAVNNRDNVAYPYDRDWNGDGDHDLGLVSQAYVNDHPLEPLARLTAGRDLGWPYCNPDPDVDPGRRGSPRAFGSRPFVRDVQTNAGGERLDCSALAPVEQGFPAHSAPLGLSFTTARGLPAPLGAGALAGVHGSWNRRPPQPPEVAFFPWRDGTLGDRVTLLSGFQRDDGSRWGRPVAAVQGPDGAVYVTDDLAGAVYRMAPP